MAQLQLIYHELPIKSGDFQWFWAKSTTYIYI